MVGNSGRYSKFQQRLRNIRLNIFYKRKLNKRNDNVNSKVKEIENLDLFQNVNIYKVKKDNVSYSSNISNISNKVDIKDNSINILRQQSIKKDIGKVNTNVFNKKKNSCSYIKKVNRAVKDVDKGNNYKDIDHTKVEIIYSLKNKFIEKVSLIEVIESELFFISDSINNSLEYSEIKELRKKIDEIIKKINAIIEQYNLYNKYDMDIVVDLDDNCLMDKIVHYRNFVDNYVDEKNFVKEYKLLDEFNNLYLKLDDIKDNVFNVENKCEKFQNRYEDRDKKYEQITLEMLRINNVDKDCLIEIDRQNNYLDKLMKDLDKIDSKDYIYSRLVGLNDLLSQGLKFLGLKLLSPLSGFIPSIASSVLVTRNMINSAYKNLHFEEVKEVYYSAVDYEDVLNTRLSDIDSVSNLIDDTMKDLSRMKSDFLVIYNSNVSGHEDTFRKIEKLEEIIYRNKVKVDMVKKRFNVSKKINENKMIKVRKLNEDRS